MEENKEQKTRSFAYVQRKEHFTVDGFIETEEVLKRFLSTEYIHDNIMRFRNGDAQAKGNLPAILWQGLPENYSRKEYNIVPNGLYLIDLDHIGEGEDDKWTPRDLCQTILSYNDFEKWNVRLMFITPSGKGLKIVAELENYDDDILESQRALVQHFTPCEKWFDEVNVDRSRISFCPLADEILFIDKRLFEISEEREKEIQEAVQNLRAIPEKRRKELNDQKKGENAGTERATLSDEELQHFKETTWRNTNKTMESIIHEYTTFRGEQLGIMVNGKPFKGEVHSLHYNIIRDIRNLCDNNPTMITALIPKFGHSYDEIYAQAKKVCSYNTTGKLAWNLYKFMVDRGYIVKYNGNDNDDDDDNEEEESDTLESPWAPYLAVMPELPPIIKEWVNAAPTEFKIPTIATLLEIIGTLTSYVQADYFDGFPHTTEFMTVISAPPAAGKSFIKRFDYLHGILQNRESLIEARERLYDSFMNTKSDNRDGKEKPQLCKRFLEPKFSEVQLFTQAFENQGLHLHTACSEMDTFGRNVRGISDLLRLAWDNDKTGQQFRSTNTFKGRVQLFWNVLLTGTPERVRAFFPSVQDGLVTRISFAPIFNSEFAPYIPWKKIPEKSIAKHLSIISRFDELTYEDPLDEASFVNCSKYTDIQEFDKNVAWRFKVRPRISRDLSYTWKPLRAWLERVRKESRRAADDAMYVYSKRSGNKGFRAALEANELWGNPQSDKMKEKVLNFGMWWATVEHFISRYMWGSEYNEAKAVARCNEGARTIKWNILFEQLPDTFTRGDLELGLRRTKNKSRPNYIAHMWIEDGLIEKVAKNEWRKRKKDNEKDNKKSNAETSMC